jgi:hypothetical protein
MKSLRHAACVLLAAASLLASPAYATSFTTDQSDLYYIVAEQGWGIQLVQRGSVIFATLFVYDVNGNPTWYTATMDYTTNLTWTGTLYATMNGTYFASPWNPRTLLVNPVGVMTWSAPLIDGGTLTYIVNGVTVVKNVVRQTLVFDDYSGHYAGYVHREFAGCPNNSTAEVPRITDITQNGTAINILETFPSLGGSCTFIGTVSEFGQMGDFQGTYVCSDGSGGTSEWLEVQVTRSGLSNRHMIGYTNPPGCQENGYFAGARVTTF